MQNIMAATSFSVAYRNWFARYERERIAQGKRKGSKLADFPDPPTNPAEIAAAVDRLGASRVIAVLQIHRSTLARWLSGSVVIPHAAWLVIAMLDAGRLPGMSRDWSEWRFDGDTLCHLGTRHSFTARELAGIPYQEAHAAALARRIEELEQEKAHLLRVGRFDCANDAIISAS